MKQGKCPKCGSEEIYAGVEVLPKSGPFGSKQQSPSALFPLLHLIIMSVRNAVTSNGISLNLKSWKKSVISGPKLARLHTRKPESIFTWKTEKSKSRFCNSELEFS